MVTVISRNRVRRTRAGITRVAQSTRYSRGYFRDAEASSSGDLDYRQAETKSDFDNGTLE